LILSALGTLIAFLKARHRFAMFAGLWAFGLLLAYTIIPYKTPWLALSFTLPMCVIAGYAINELANSREALQKILAGVLGVVAIGVLAYQTYDLNFERYDDEEMPYVYAHTRRGFHDLIAQIEYYAEKSGKGNEATVEVVSPDYWAMPWYLKDYKNANFHGQLVDANTAEMIVAKKGDQDSEAVRRYAAHYKLAGEYPLRPGVDLMLLVKRDLADSDAKELYQIQTPSLLPGGVPPP
jgi:predicted membrane-bound mannosyltransferase